MDCKSCEEKRKQAEPVPFQTHQADMSRMERANNRLWILCIILAALFVGHLWYDSQFEDVVTETIETSTDGGGDAYGTIVSGDNSGVYYGESQSNAD